MPAKWENTARSWAEIALPHRLCAYFFCALPLVQAIAPVRAFAQTASLPAGSAAQSVSQQQAPFIAPVSPQERSLLAGAADLARNRSTPVAPAASVERPLLSGAVDIAEGYATNPSGTQGSGSSDTFTRGRFDLNLHYESLRLKTEGHASLSGYYYGRDHSLNQMATRLNLATIYDVVPDHLSVHLNAFAAPTYLSRVGSLSATGGTISNNYQQSYGYLVEPVLNLKLGGYAFSQTSVSENAISFSQPITSTTDATSPITSNQDTNSITATERIISKPYFGRLRWGLTGSYSNTTQTTETLQQSQGTADVAYALDRAIALLTTVGYGEFESSTPLTRNISGPIALAGFRYSIGPNFTLITEAGTSNGFATYLGSLNWNPTPTLSITGSLSDSVGVAQGNILNNLSTLAASAEGVFSYSQSNYLQGQGQAFNPQSTPASPIPLLGLALDSSVYHSRNAQLAFVHTDERNQYGITLFATTRDRLSVTTDGTPSASSLYGMSLNVSRKLRRDLIGNAGISYSLANEFSGQDRILTADAGLTYLMAKNLSTYITGRYLRRNSSGQIVNNAPLPNIESDFEAIVGIRRGF